jgi:hypothetical protein
MTLTPGSAEAVAAAIASVEGMIISPDTGGPVLAYASIPLSVPTANMPCMINFPGRMIENRLLGSDGFQGREFMETRMWDLVLYHSPMASGTPEEKSQLLVPYFELVYVQFGLYPRLNATQGVKDAMLVGDSGVATVEHTGNQFWGIRFQLRVSRQVRRLLAESD